jgi:hypothetical protein
MIDRWVRAGRPLDETVRHPMGPWAQTVGGILMVNGFKNFLTNYTSTRSAADPIREALGILAFYAGRGPLRAGEIAKLVVSQGLAKTLLANVDSSNEAACQRAMGVVLSPYVDETFIARTSAEKLTYRLRKQEGRFGEPHPHYRYSFEEVGREAVAGDSSDGPVLEEESNGSNYTLHRNLELDQFKPETI